MARTVHIELLDDIDGTAAEETLRYGLDGVTYEIDVNAAHAEKLRKALARFILKSRRVARGRVTAETGTTVSQRLLMPREGRMAKESKPITT